MNTSFDSLEDSLQICIFCEHFTAVTETGFLVCHAHYTPFPMLYHDAFGNRVIPGVTKLIMDAKWI